MRSSRVTSGSVSSDDGLLLVTLEAGSQQALLSTAFEGFHPPQQDDKLPEWASASTRTLVTFSDSNLSHITSYMVIRQPIPDLQTARG